MTVIIYQTTSAIRYQHFNAKSLPTLWIGRNWFYWHPRGMTRVFWVRGSPATPHQARSPEQCHSSAQEHDASCSVREHRCNWKGSSGWFRYDVASNLATLRENIAVIRSLQDKTFKYSFSLCFYTTLYLIR